MLFCVYPFCLFCFYLILLYFLYAILFLICFDSHPICLSEALQQWQQRTEYTVMQCKFALKNCVASLTALQRTVQFIERRTEAADLPVGDLARHLSRAETAAEKRCLWLKAGQKQHQSRSLLPLFLLAVSVGAVYLQKGRGGSQQNEGEGRGAACPRSPRAGRGA